MAMVALKSEKLQINQGQNYKKSINHSRIIVEFLIFLFLDFEPVHIENLPT